MQMGETRSMEIRATINNVFNTVQYSGVTLPTARRNSAKSLRWARCGNVSVHGEIQILRRQRLAGSAERR